jgi:signal transduction histidine kinase
VSIRARVVAVALFLLAVSLAGTAVIIGNIRALVRNQETIVFKDRVYHEHERARRLIQTAQSRLYQHQAGYTRDIDTLVSDISEFEAIAKSITPLYRERYTERDCTVCHRDGLRKIDQLEDTFRAILASLDRYKESVSIILTTNDRQARLLHNGIANARGEEILAGIARANETATNMMQRLREHAALLAERAERAIVTSVAAVGVIFVATMAWLLLSFNRIFSALLHGTESVAHDDFSHRLPAAARKDEFGLLASRFNLMAEHLQEREALIREKTAQLEDANRRLHDLNENLEDKVQERTLELERTLEQVQRTSVALEDSKRRLEAANLELVRANQAKANFLSIISHELKTPLSVINGFLSLILDERYQNDPQNMREAVLISKRRGEQLSRMIDELIDLSRLDARSMVLRREETDPAEILRDIGVQFQEEFRRRQLRFSLALREGLPRLVCDPEKLRQVLTNLVTNAIKFSPDGGEIELGAELRGDDLLFTCRDTGIGIPESEQEKIFEKFYQVDSSATRRFGGAGLGLSVLKEIVLLHGGRVWVRSAPGAGSTFFVLLPRQPRDLPLPAGAGPA